MSRWDKWFGFAHDEVFEEAVSAYDRGDFDEAIEGFRRCERENSSRDETRLSRFYTAQSLAHIARKNLVHREPATALNNVQQALEFQPHNSELLLLAARACHDLKLYQWVDRYVSECLALNPTFVDAVLLEAICLFEQGKVDEAIDRLQIAQSLDSKLDAQELERVKELAESGQDISGHLHKYAASWEPEVDLHLRVGESFMRNRQFSAAIKEFQAALKIAPESADANCGIGEEFQSVGLFRESLAPLEECLRINPCHSDALARVAVAYQEVRRPVESESALNRVLSLSPDHPIGVQMGSRALA